MTFIGPAFRRRVDILLSPVDAGWPRLAIRFGPSQMTGQISVFGRLTEMGSMVKTYMWGALGIEP
jgi:hypothetical protein